MRIVSVLNESNKESERFDGVRVYDIMAFDIRVSSAKEKKTIHTRIQERTIHAYNTHMSMCCQ